MLTNEDASRRRAGWLDGGLQLFASDIDDREGGGDAIKSDGKRAAKIERDRVQTGFEQGKRERASEREQENEKEIYL